MATKTTKERRAKGPDQDELALTTALEPARSGGNGAQHTPVYSHKSRHRCPRCGVLMRANGTTAGGARKRWICSSPVCRKTDETSGELV